MKVRKFRASGLTLNCLDYGGEGKPPLLFVHGGAAHAHWWDFVAPAFIDRFHALALDLRGHGDSEWPNQWEYATQHYVADLEEVIANWGLSAPILVGHSMGGHNALVYATRHAERLRALIAIDTAPNYSPGVLEFLRSFAARPVRRFASLEQACRSFRLLPTETIAKREVLEHVARFSYRRDADGRWTQKIDRRTMIREPIDAWDGLGLVTCPVLVVKIINSPTLDRDVASRMARAMPRARLAEIDKGHHHIMFDDPEALIALLGDFFRGIE
jgi:pimeloyl-ACP methyl ester carboxylesterase